jgi:hypothetical protein
MISVGSGMFLLALAVCGVIMCDTLWIKIVCSLYLGLYAIGSVIEIMRGRWEPTLLVIPVLLVLLGMYAHGVHHMFDPKDRGKR